MSVLWEARRRQRWLLIWIWCAVSPKARLEPNRMSILEGPNRSRGAFGRTESRPLSLVKQMNWRFQSWSFVQIKFRWYQWEACTPQPALLWRESSKLSLALSLSLGYTGMQCEFCLDWLGLHNENPRNLEGMASLLSCVLFLFCHPDGWTNCLIYLTNSTSCTLPLPPAVVIKRLHTFKSLGRISQN